MISSKKKAMRAAVRAYVSEVLADLLRAEGFFPTGDALTCWIRRRNNLVQYVFVYDTFGSGPPWLSFCYGVEPLFVPLMTFNTHRPSPPPKHTRRFVYCAPKSYRVYSLDIPVTCPNTESFGAEIVIEMLSDLNKINTIEECYAFNRSYRVELESTSPETIRYYLMSDSFIDQAIYANDTEMFPYCQRAAKLHLNILSKITSSAELAFKYHPYDTTRKPEDWELRIAAMEPGGRESYLEILAQRERAGIKSFQTLYNKYSKL